MVVATSRLLLGGAVTPVGDGPYPVTMEGPENHPPIAADDRASVHAGATIEDPVPGLLFNDVDPDGDPLIAIHKGPAAHGTAIVRRDGSWSYTPAAGFAGTDHFTYLVSDGVATSSLATVTITVRGPAGTATPIPSASASATTTPTSPPPSPAAAPPQASPPSGPREETFSVPDGADSAQAADDIGLEASAAAGLGPVLWIVPSLLLGLPGLGLVVLLLGRAIRRSRRVPGSVAASAQAGAAARS